MHVQRPALLIAALLVCLVAPQGKGQKQASDADGRIVTSAASGTPVQEDEQLATGAPSVNTAWSLLTAALTTAKRPQSRVQA
ncbi:MAG TPA: hypothetical protein VLI45_06525, partial [Acidobacteriaceae bacterium]|nr:hypothetical protein [Acidobacteriaceae bacterium]